MNKYFVAKPTMAKPKMTKTLTMNKINMAK